MHNSRTRIHFSFGSSHCRSHERSTIPALSRFHFPIVWVSWQIWKLKHCYHGSCLNATNLPFQFRMFRALKAVPDRFWMVKPNRSMKWANILPSAWDRVPLFETVWSFHGFILLRALGQGLWKHRAQRSEPKHEGSSRSSSCQALTLCPQPLAFAKFIPVCRCLQGNWM
jgi:hypothetical protein